MIGVIINFEYTDLVRDVVDCIADEYQEYLDNLEPGEDAQDPWEFASDESLHQNIENVLITSHAVWTVIMEHCSNEYEVFSGEAPDYDGGSAYMLFYDDCMNEFMEQMR